jgi:hypothetical protein
MCSKLCKTLQTVATLLQNFYNTFNSQLYKQNLYKQTAHKAFTTSTFPKTIKHVIKLYTTLQIFTQQNFSRLAKTLQHFTKYFTQLHKHKLYTTLQFFAKLYRTFQKSTKLYKTFQNIYTTLLQHIQHFTTTSLQDLKIQ